MEAIWCDTKKIQNNTYMKKKKKHCTEEHTQHGIKSRFPKTTVITEYI